MARNCVWAADGSLLCTPSQLTTQKSKTLNLEPGIREGFAEFRDTLYGNGNGVASDVLLPGQSLWSKDKQHFLTYQYDGNLVLTPAAVYSADAFSDNPSRAEVQGDGNFVLYNKDNVAYWSTRTANAGTGPFTLTVQNSRNIVLTDDGNHGTLLWDSKSTKPRQCRERMKY
ncbi:hypothetical protein TSOC_011614 [Tetrabaena socialis]|uniref:Bulb-type lectin domain-containing protein n=1 Tax=Tetrabaena socialis TaxID=47790 RepID=A0A2J7ZNB1_9CHLO|nr:hypothetical protein TSOC_012341 [Tetrabaena socialis]PNH02409.1 hypothetical protein TSOC_011614 [Tetrabaena socialis]|eukprot:PNH01747.1 hypothetical protein TSOC_012341 [Tetrabaena socialis]